jgi:hypothetical protein
MMATARIMRSVGQKVGELDVPPTRVYRPRWLLAVQSASSRRASALEAPYACGG